MSDNMIDSDVYLEEVCKNLNTAQEGERRKNPPPPPPPPIKPRPVICMDEFPFKGKSIFGLFKIWS